jgi:imidazolonepropionase-like amidohydrolase
MPTLAAQERYIDIFRNSLEFSSHELKHSNSDVTNSFEQANAQIEKADQMFNMIRKYMPYVDATPEKMEKLTPQQQNVVSQLSDMFSNKVIMVQQQNLKRMFDGGVTLALGTDAGNPGTLHGGSMLIEMKAWRQAGIPLDAILSAATINNAKVTKKDHLLGSIEVGKLADLIILDKNPLAAVENFSSINAVIKHGNVLTMKAINKHLTELK